MLPLWWGSGSPLRGDRGGNRGALMSHCFTVPSTVPLDDSRGSPTPQPWPATLRFDCCEHSSVALIQQHQGVFKTGRRKFAVTDRPQVFSDGRERPTEDECCERSPFPPSSKRVPSIGQHRSRVSASKSVEGHEKARAKTSSVVGFHRGFLDH